MTALATPLVITVHLRWPTIWRVILGSIIANPTVLILIVVPIIQVFLAEILRVNLVVMVLFVTIMPLLFALQYIVLPFFSGQITLARQKAEYIITDDGIREDTLHGYSFYKWKSFMAYNKFGATIVLVTISGEAFVFPAYSMSSSQYSAFEDLIQRKIKRE